MEITGPDGKRYNQPFRAVPVPDSVSELSRSTEEKLYVVLYYNIEYEEYKFAKFNGRYNTYFGIKNILDSESVDLHASEVLVETVGIDPKTNKARRYLIHPDDAADLMGFCHQMEAFFGDNAYSIEEYDTGYTIKDMADYMDEHPEPTEIDYKKLNSMLNKNNQVEQESESDAAPTDSMGISRSILNSARDAKSPFMSIDETKEIGKQFFTSANMGDVSSQEI